jgi:hypothetical protein
MVQEKKNKVKCETESTVITPHVCFRRHELQWAHSGWVVAMKSKLWSRTWWDW